jgi:D-alanine-D-alanine ligase
MKVALVYNRESKRVINLFGMPNLEKIRRQSITRILNALKTGGHQVRSIEGDKDLIDKLEEFMPQVLKGEKPGMVFNVSYGSQGQARYTHIPSILEMIGIPYVGSGPLAHSLSLDKVVSKMIFTQKGILTPDFFVLETLESELPEMVFPAIVKPKNEAVSFGIKIVHNKEELKEAARAIFERFNQPVLVEQYIEGREINVGILGNSPVEIFQPCEIVFGETGPSVYTYEDKTRKSGRNITWDCPAHINDELTTKAQDIALKAYRALGCYDCARVDMRIDSKGNLYVLEVNSLPSLGEHGSYTIAAEQFGLDFNALVNRLVDVAYQRYFGTIEKSFITKRDASISTKIPDYITRNRDTLEKSVKKWCRFSSRTGDSLGINNILSEVSEIMLGLGLVPVPEYTDGHFTWMWQTKAGFEKGSILITNIDVPFKEQDFKVAFKKEPEWIYGEGIATSRGPLAELEYSLRALKYAKKINNRKIGVLIHADEGLSCQYSNNIIKNVTQRASRVLVLKPAPTDKGIIIDRRGQRTYQLLTEVEPTRIEKQKFGNDLINSIAILMKEIKEACKPYSRTSIVITRTETKAYNMHVPHWAKATLLMNYASTNSANKLENTIFEIAKRKKRFYKIVKDAERPPLPKRSINLDLAKELVNIARTYEINLSCQSSAWPSVAGLVPATVPVVCGIGPFAKSLSTPDEAIHRLSLIQRCLILADYLSKDSSY